MKTFDEARLEMETEVGRLIVTLSALDGLVYPCKPLLFGETCSKKWASKTSKQRIDAVQARIRSLEPGQTCTHLTELSHLLDDAKPLLELRNLVAHRILTFRPSALSFFHGEFTMWNPDTQTTLSVETLSKASDAGRHILCHLYDCLADHQRCVPDNYPDNIEEALDPP